MFRMRNKTKQQKQKLKHGRQTRKLALAVSLPYSPQLFLIYTIVYVVLLQSKTFKLCILKRASLF